MHGGFGLSSISELADIDYINEQVYEMVSNLMNEGYTGEFEIDISGIVIHPECCVCHERSKDVKGITGSNVCEECVDSDEYKEILDSIDVDRRWKEQQESRR